MNREAYRKTAHTQHSGVYHTSRFHHCDTRYELQTWMLYHEGGEASVCLLLVSCNKETSDRCQVVYVFPITYVQYGIRDSDRHGQEGKGSRGAHWDETDRSVSVRVYYRTHISCAKVDYLYIVLNLRRCPLLSGYVHSIDYYVIHC